MIDINRFRDGWQVRSSGLCELAYLLTAHGWTQRNVEEVRRIAEDYADGEFEDGEAIGQELNAEQAADDRKMVEHLEQYTFENGEKYDLTNPKDIKRLYDLAYPKEKL